MEMSEVTKCFVEDCAYNTDNCCHTIAITVGDGSNPQCDTFCQSSIPGGKAGCVAGIGACKVSVCKFNANLECTASGVSIGYKDNEPDCLSFQPK